jgi:hypothetical protein
MMKIAFSPYIRPHKNIKMPSIIQIIESVNTVSRIKTQRFGTHKHHFESYVPNWLFFSKLFRFWNITSVISKCNTISEVTFWSCIFFNFFLDFGTQLLKFSNLERRFWNGWIFETQNMNKIKNLTLKQIRGKKQFSKLTNFRF